jgi:hypothetical protein
MSEPTKDGYCESPDGPCRYRGSLRFRESCLQWLCPSCFAAPCGGHCVNECRPAAVADSGYVPSRTKR